MGVRTHNSVSTKYSSEGCELASSYDCKFIETSVGLNHHVDELLVGVLKQILLRQEQDTGADTSLEIKVRITELWSARDTRL